jgi:hypothetical protein
VRREDETSAGSATGKYVGVAVVVVSLVVAEVVVVVILVRKQWRDALEGEREVLANEQGVGIKQQEDMHQVNIRIEG